MTHTLIVPAHNEAEHLIPFFTAFIDHLVAETRAAILEILVVENGSSDDTIGAARRLEQQYPDLVRAFSVDRPSYGEAIRQGMLQARGDTLSILEVDYLAADFVEDSIRLFRETDVKFIVASKRHPESKDCRPFKRRMLTLGFNLILNTLVGYPGSDTHGLKSIETALAQELCALAQTTDEVFQTEIVLLAWRLGHRIHELPITLKEQRPAPVSVARRLPKVMDMTRQLRRSIARFPKQGGK